MYLRYIAFSIPIAIIYILLLLLLIRKKKKEHSWKYNCKDCQVYHVRLTYYVYSVMVIITMVATAGYLTLSGFLERNYLFSFLMGVSVIIGIFISSWLFLTYPFTRILTDLDYLYYESIARTQKIAYNDIDDIVISGSSIVIKSSENDLFVSSRFKNSRNLTFHVSEMIAKNRT